MLHYECLDLDVFRRLESACQQAVEHKSINLCHRRPLKLQSSETCMHSAAYTIDSANSATTHAAIANHGRRTVEKMGVALWQRIYDQ